jgi:hypothetical protein
VRYLASQYLERAQSERDLSPESRVTNLQGDTAK